MIRKEEFINLYNQKHVYKKPESLICPKVGMKFDFIWKKLHNF